jgi:hypothetical protein
MYVIYPALGSSATGKEFSTWYKNDFPEDGSVREETYKNDVANKRRNL